MKKMIGIMMTVVLVLTVLSGCGADRQQTAGLSGSVSTNGSTSMDKVIGILSEQFMNDNPDVTVTYDATGSGTRDGFESMTNTTDKCVLKQELTSTGAVITAVQNNQNAIGYASLAAAEGQDGIKILAVEGVPCSAENITNGSYVIQRPFNLITKGGGTLSEAAQAFFDYVVSAEAAELITEAGAVPMAK